MGKGTLTSEEVGEIQETGESFLDSHAIQDKNFRKDFLEREIGFCFHITQRLRAILDTLPTEQQKLILWDIDGVIGEVCASFVRPSFQILAEIIRRQYPGILYGMLTSTCPIRRFSKEGDLFELKDIFKTEYFFSSEYAYLFGPSDRCRSCSVVCGEFYDEDSLCDPESRSWKDAMCMQKIDGYKTEVGEILRRSALGGILDKMAVLRFLLEEQRIPSSTSLIWIDDILSAHHITELQASQKTGKQSPIPQDLHFITNECYTPVCLP